mmetsp:Transcript_51212/g.121930  ORF Transcript_51212/g.121930 Transcript_51212/m.121930 type:complete len:226 (+) Transcript_51212:85-762(+)
MTMRYMCHASSGSIRSDIFRRRITTNCWRRLAAAMPSSTTSSSVTTCSTFAHSWVSKSKTGLQAGSAVRLMGPTSNVKNLNLRHTLTKVLQSTVLLSVISPYIRRSSRWRLLPATCETMPVNSPKSRLPSPSESEATNSARNRSSARPASSFHCSTMKARSLSRSMYFPDDMWSASTSTLERTTEGACAKMYSITLRPRAASMLRLSIGGRSGNCPFCSFTRAER